jgi:hypothetical protein
MFFKQSISLRLGLLLQFAAFCTCLQLIQAAGGDVAGARRAAAAAVHRRRLCRTGGDTGSFGTGARSISMLQLSSVDTGRCRR